MRASIATLPRDAAGERDGMALEEAATRLDERLAERRAMATACTRCGLLDATHDSLCAECCDAYGPCGRCAPIERAEVERELEAR